MTHEGDRAEVGLGALTQNALPSALTSESSLFWPNTCIPPCLGRFEDTIQCDGATASSAHLMTPLSAENGLRSASQMLGCAQWRVLGRKTAQSLGGSDSSTHHGRQQSTPPSSQNCTLWNTDHLNDIIFKMSKNAHLWCKDRRLCAS